MPLGGPGGAEVGQQGAGDGRRDDGVAGGHQPDRIDDVGRWGVLDQESAGAGAEGGHHVLVGLEGGEHDDMRWRVEPPKFRGCRDPVHLGHPDAHEDDVRTVLPDGCDRVGTVVGLADDVDVLNRGQDES